MNDENFAIIPHSNNEDLLSTLKYIFISLRKSFYFFFSKLTLAQDMKSIIQIPILLFLLLFVNYGHSKTIKVATQKDYFPYSSVDSLGVYQGLLIDWWELWAVKAEVDLEFIPGNTLK